MAIKIIKKEPDNICTLLKVHITIIIPLLYIISVIWKRQNKTWIWKSLNPASLQKIQGKEEHVK